MHIPVLQKEIIEIFCPESGDHFIDATINGGGHTKMILEKIIPNGKVLGIDLDKELINRFNFQFPISNFQKNLILVNNNFTNIKRIVSENKFENIKGILFDLGMSSFHIDDAGRGFSFKRDEPLDMRYSQNFQFPISNFQNVFTAAEVINHFGEKELADIFWKYGEERFSRRIAKNIVETRKKKRIKTTLDLVDIIRRSVPGNYENGRIHCATRVFQSLRIAVNHELENLESALPQALDILDPSGILIIISFHSLEDRIVKNFFRENKNQGIILTKKPIIADVQEVRMNIRSRSAKLRAFKKLEISN